MFYNILNEERKKILPKLSAFKEEYYLAGGTALALQIGHRVSEDFDFFTARPFPTEGLFKRVLATFEQYPLQKIQEENNTLTILINNIKLSFFHDPYLILEPLIELEHLQLASVIDIGCMKLSAVVSRAAMKDYVDLYFILQMISLEELLVKCEQKLPSLDRNLILKSLVYFEDIIEEPIHYIPTREVSNDDIKGFLKTEVKKNFDNIKS